MGQIKYIGFYNTIENFSENRLSVLPATNKMDYIVSKLNQLGWDINIVSPSWTNNKKYYKGKKIQINKKKVLTLPPTLPWGNIMKFFSMVLSQLWLFFYLIFHTRKNEKIIVYHSLALMFPLYFAKKIKGFILILEVEEIYQDIRKINKCVSNMEYKIIKLADKYIFSTELLNEKLNNLNKPYTIIYGTYQVEMDRKTRFEDGKIHIVYAGNFDPQKGGATAAASAAAFLPEKYHLHIIGSGGEKLNNNMQELISKIGKTSECTVSYDGLLIGEDYIRFLQGCDIGLSTQMPDAAFNNSSFPSKILSYMANGLRVVSIRIKAIEMSAIGESIYYYEEQTSEDIAKTIMSIDVKKQYNCVELIRKLDKDFEKNIRKLLEINSAVENNK